VSNAPSKPVSFSRPKVGYFSNRPRSFYIVVYNNFYIVIIVRQVGSHIVNIITLYFALFQKFCIGDLMMVFADPTMLSCLSKK